MNVGTFRIILALIAAVMVPRSLCYGPKSYARRSLLKTPVIVGASATASPLLFPSPALSTTATPSPVPTIQLGSLRVSKTISGYWTLAGGHGPVPPTITSTMSSYISHGITTMDTADIYGPSESYVGKVSKSDPNAVVCTKFCCFRNLESISRAEVRARIIGQRDKLMPPGKPLDLVAFFWADYGVKRYSDVALWLAELRAEGLIREIGITNFDLKRTKEMVDAGVPIVSSQVQCSALDRRPIQSGNADYCKDNGIKLISFGAVGAGILSSKYLGKPAPQNAETVSQRMYGGTAKRFGDWGLVQELLVAMDAVAVEVCKRCPGVTIANVAQRYELQTDPTGGAVLIGVRNLDHIEENLRTHHFKLTEGEVDSIEKIVAKRKGPVGDVWGIERGLV